MSREPEGASRDPIEQQITAAEQFLAENGIRVVRGSVFSEESCPEILWDEDGGDHSRKDFLEAAAALGARFVALSVTRLEQEEWEEAKVDAEAIEEPEERTARLRELRACEAYVGHVRQAVLRWFSPSPPVLFSLFLEALWSETFGTEPATEPEEDDEERDLSETEVRRLAQPIAEDPQFQTASGRTQYLIAEKLLGPDHKEHVIEVLHAAQDIFEREVRPKLESGPDVEEWTRRLAQDTRFHRAKSNAQKDHVAKVVVPASIKASPIKFWKVVEQAGTLYELEVKPELERQLQAQAVELQRQGLNKKQIAEKLGLSPSQLSKLI